MQLQKVEAHLGEQLIGFVPNDYRKVMDSINLGNPLVKADPSSKITTEIRRIAALVPGNNHSPSEPTRKRSLGTMFGRTNPNFTAGSFEAAGGIVVRTDEVTSLGSGLEAP